MMQKIEWTKDKIVCLPTNELRAVSRSTNPSGKFWQELVWARDELDRRSKARRIRFLGSNDQPSDELGEQP